MDQPLQRKNTRQRLRIQSRTLLSLRAENCLKMKSHSGRCNDTGRTCFFSSSCRRFSLASSIFRCFSSFSLLSISSLARLKILTILSLCRWDLYCGQLSWVSDLLMVPIAEHDLLIILLSNAVCASISKLMFQFRSSALMGLR